MRATLLFTACLLAWRLCAAEPKVESGLSATEIYEGEAVQLQVRVTSDANNIKLDTAALKTDFEVAESQPQKSSSSSIQIINGQMFKDESTSTTYSFQLTPKRPGSLKIPAVKVDVDGKQYLANAFVLNVTAPEKQDYAMLEITTSKLRVFAMEPFEVTLKIRLRQLPNDAKRDPLHVLPPPALTINWLDKIPDGLKVNSDFSKWLDPFLNRTGSGRGFTLNNLSNGDIFYRNKATLSLYTGREKRKALDGKEYEYFIYELKRTFIPLHPGAFTFGPANMKGTVAIGIDNDRKSYVPKSLYVIAPSRTVVCEMPEPKPADFSGCIGDYTLRASVNATDLRVGDPVTLKLEFERGEAASGLEDINAPDLTANKQLTEDFTIVDKAPPGQAKDNVKSFSYTIRPKKKGVSIPALSVSAFNFKSGAYEKLSSEPVKLNVIDAPQLRAEELVSSAPIGSGQKISGRDNGVFQNITELSELHRPAPKVSLYVLGVAGLWLAYGILFVVLKFMRKRAGDLVWQQRALASGEAATHLNAARTALKSGDAWGSALSVQMALSSAIGHRAKLTPAGMTAQDADMALQKFNVPAESRAEVVRIFEYIEGAKYGSRDGLKAESLVDSAEKLLPKLQREMDAKKN